MGAICARSTERKTSISSDRGDPEDGENNNNNTTQQTQTGSSTNSRWSFVPKDHVVKDVYTLFNVEKELGRGASCRVLRVERKSDKKRFAMKEMKRNDRWNPMLFEQEVKILQTLAGHKNILQLIET